MSLEVLPSRKEVFEPDEGRSVSISFLGLSCLPTVLHKRHRLVRNSKYKTINSHRSRNWNVFPEALGSPYRGVFVRSSKTSRFLPIARAPRIVWSCSVEIKYKKYEQMKWSIELCECERNARASCTFAYKAWPFVLSKTLPFDVCHRDFI